MHEMSLAGGVLKLVEDAALHERFTRVERLRLEAGALAGVDIASLRFALEAIAPGTALEGAAIEIDQAPGTAWCLVCSAGIALAARGDACPRCGGWQLTPTGGTELKLRELIVHDD